MAVQLKKLSDQVVVITGATSGIGLSTARMADETGAKLVLVAREQNALDRLVAEFRRHGSAAIGVAADVGQRSETARVAQAAQERFGRIDTWINNAGVSIFGRLEDVPLEDQQRLFQTNFWGVVNGSLEAVKAMRRHSGGAVINLGGEVSDRAVPLQGMYSASKHAVKGFTDALRVELEQQGVPISVTLVKPAAIDTMFTVHAKNFMEVEPALPAPVYAPELVARAILYAAEHPKRDVFVGGAAKVMSLAGFHMPRLLDRYMRARLVRQQRSGQPSAARRPDALHGPDPTHELRERKGYAGHVAEHCPYTALSLRSRALKLALFCGGALWAGWRLMRPAR